MGTKVKTKPQEYELGKDRCILCVGPHCWGKGQTKAEANKKAREHKPSWVKGAYRYYDAPADVYVDEMGSAHWKDGTQQLREIA